MSKKFFASIVTSLAILVSPVVAFAHVIVTPNQVGIGKEQLFSISVPNEQQTPVVNIKLDIPQSVTNVIPTAKAGWTVTTTDNGDTKNPVITAITWSKGSIAVGQRDDFSFSAQAPANATELDWKAYQTYSDGTVVHWDQKPAGSDDSTGNAGPYSTTQVVNDLQPTKSVSSNKSNTGPYIVSGLGFLVAIAALLYKRK